VIAEPLQDWERIAGALVTRGTTLTFQSRFEEGKALLERGLDLAIEHDLQHVVIRAHNNLAVMLLGADHAHDALEHYDRGHAAARARGDRPWEALLVAGKCSLLFIVGRWDEFAELSEPQLSELSEDVSYAELFALHAFVAAARGDLDALNALDAPAGSAQSADTQVRYVVMLGQGAVAAANGRTKEAFEILREVVRIPNPETRRNAYIAAAEAAWELEDAAALEELIALVDQLPPADATPLMQGEAARFAGLLAARRGDLGAAEERLDAAIVLIRELGYLYELAKVLLARGELLLEADRAGESIRFIDEARTILADLGAKPLLARAEQALAGRPASAA
jgi:tetratricopeptide (TPR) repeat protein